MIKRLKEIIKERKNKKKKGFTLVELLAVIVILAIIMVITIPTVLGSMSKSKEKAFETVGQTMKKYLQDNYNNCRLGNTDIAKYDEVLFKTDGSCQLNDNISDALITNSGYSTNDIEKVDVTEDGRGNFGVDVSPKQDGQFEGMVDNSINSVPNAPDLSTGLVPIKYNGENWVVTTSTDPEWFDYANQKWANAASLVSGVSKGPGTVLRVPNGDEMTAEDANETDILAMFVWIPRYSYTIGCTSSTSCLGYKIEGASNLSQSTPGAIDIKFVSKEHIDSLNEVDNVYATYTYTNQEDRNPINWYTHPAFTFGDDELSGIWVGKFETSVNPNSVCYNYLINELEAEYKCVTTVEDVTPRILPNVLSLVYQNVYNQFKTAQKFSVSGNIYEINSERADSHMMKNSEWGAVVYLSQSIYGKYGNLSYDRVYREIYKNDSGTSNGSKSWARYTGRSKGDRPDNSYYSDKGKFKYDGVSTVDSTKDAKKGTGASTTGNIYGIYDMSGGADEYVMGYYTEVDYVFGGLVSYGAKSSPSGFNDDRKPDNKYFDGYIGMVDGETKTINLFEKSKEIIGHATYETKKWYLDHNYNIKESDPWVTRGLAFYSNSITGIFATNNSSGGCHSNTSFRSVLVTVK